MNFDAGSVRSMTGPSGVKVRTPVAISARSVDWLRMGLARRRSWWIARRGAANLAEMIGWMVAEAADRAAQDKRNSEQHCQDQTPHGDPLSERDAQPHPPKHTSYISPG